MPKKIGTNSKAEAARERKTAIEAEKKEKEAREKEEHFWREAEGAKSRAARKKEEEAEKRAEASARRAENRRLAEAEQRQLEIESRKPDKKAARVSVPVPKVTGADLERRRRWRGFRGRRRRRKSRVAEEEYERTVLVANTNRNEAVVEAHSVEEALAKMNVSDALPPDRHPERRLKASFKEFNIGFRNSNISRWVKFLQN